MCYEPTFVCKLIVSSMTLHNACINYRINLCEEDVHFLENTYLPLLEDANEFGFGQENIVENRSNNDRRIEVARQLLQKKY